jgi:phage replication O-like protein O
MDLNGDYFKFPNKIAERLHGFSKAELKIILVIYRKTLGWRKDMDRISYSQFQECTGLARSNIRKAIADLLKKQVICAERHGQMILYGPCITGIETLLGGSSKAKPVSKRYQNQYQNSTETSSKTVHTKERKKKETIKVSKKPPVPYFKEATDYWFELWKKKYNVNPSWGGKEGSLLKADLKRLNGHPTQSPLQILSMAMDFFFEEKSSRAVKWASGESYGTFHSCLDSILKELIK